MSAYWFKPHRYGLGARPSTWQGVALVAAYVLAALGLSIWFERSGQERLPEFVIGLAVLTGGLLFVSWRRTEGGWRWRWGDKD